MESKQENTENQNSGNPSGKDKGSGIDNLQNDNSVSGNLNDIHAATGDDTNTVGENIDATDKYLAMEQEGVTYTQDTDPTLNSDQIDFGSENKKNEWNSEGGNSRNSDAFNQDDYLLNDNLDLDEDQNQSLSSDDEDFEETNERY